ncbi:MAG: hypothetical protein RIS86_941 [Planctomycetota bacterium]
MHRRDRATIHVVGSMMIDRVVRVRAVPRAGETMAASSAAVHPGGKGANQAAAAARCGARVRMLGRTGADGAFIRDALREAGVGVRAIRTDDPVSGAATVMVADDGENAIVIAPESNLRIGLADIERFLAKARQGEIVLFQNESGALFDGIAAAAARGLRVWLNAAPADAGLRALKFEKLAGLVVNETEAEVLTGERDPRAALELLARWMPGGTVIVTLGAAGAVAAVGAARYAHRGFVVDAVDTVGCGDAFVGAYLAAVAAGKDAAQALAWGNAAGALAAMRAGAMPSLAGRAEVEVAAALPEGTRLKPRAAGGEGFEECPRCGYRVLGHAIGAACAECGGALGRDPFRGRWRERRVRRRFAWGAWASMLAGAGGAVFLGLFLLGLLIDGRRAIPQGGAIGPVILVGMFAAIATHALSGIVAAVQLDRGAATRARVMGALLALRVVALLWALAPHTAWGLQAMLFSRPRIPFAVAMVAEAAMAVAFARSMRAGGAAEPWRALPVAAAVAALGAAVPLLFLRLDFDERGAVAIAFSWLASQALAAWMAWRLVRRVKRMEGR